MGRVLVVTGDPQLLDDLLRLAAAGGAVVDVAHDPGGARPRWRDAPLVLLGADALDATAALGLARREGVIAVATDAQDTAVWRRAVAVGAEHVTFLPDAEPWLVERVRDALAGHGTAAVLGIVGGRGGAGATTFAVALATAGAAGGRRTVLIDADPHGGGIDLVLGSEQEPGPRWPEIAAAPAAPGDLLATLPAYDGLTVLSWDRSSPLQVSPGHLRALLGAARRRSDLVVVDVPRSFDDAARVALGSLTCALVVVPAEVRACASAARVVEAVSACVADVRVVVRGPAPSGLLAEQVAEAVGVPLAGWLPPEPGLAAALERGDPPGRRRGPLARLCGTLLDELAGTAP